MFPRSHAFIWTSQESSAQSVRNPGTYLYRIMFQCFQNAVLTMQTLLGYGSQLSSPCKFNMMKACIIQTLHLKKSYIHVVLHHHPSILSESRVPNAATAKHWFAARYPYKFNNNRSVCNPKSPPEADCVSIVYSCRCLILQLAGSRSPTYFQHPTQPGSQTLYHVLSLA